MFRTRRHCPLLVSSFYWPLSFTPEIRFLVSASTHPTHPTPHPTPHIGPCIARSPTQVLSWHCGFIRGVQLPLRGSSSSSFNAHNILAFVIVRCFFSRFSSIQFPGLFSAFFFVMHYLSVRGEEFLFFRKSPGRFWVFSVFSRYGFFSTWWVIERTDAPYIFFELLRCYLMLRGEKRGKEWRGGSEIDSLPSPFSKKFCKRVFYITTITIIISLIFVSSFNSTYVYFFSLLSMEEKTILYSVVPIR